ncbi:Transmembrane domain-containing protein [Orpheovirus IHUMI-LCC2]|uniref:Transmembrane domain-containing protein n=1 Tax=Orpheovirus IHUMI-LCC2 TaxID=2023057 RepID=A0A2I2L4B1_9VIRU|nr:Transmembrane domain-containing protein [Orpheovirus IHUMI-LCC2]SNW62368.1 Transmembrane domain-containing protein [Orpheovirus IHUMI-LCC2]
MLTSTLLFASAISLGKGLYNHGIMNNNMNEINASFLSHEKKMKGEIRKGQYLLEYKLNKNEGEYVKTFKCYDFRVETSQPVYVNVGKHGPLVPIGGGSYTTRNKVADLLVYKLNNVNSGFCYKLHPYYNEAEKRKTLPYERALDYAKDKYGVKLSKYGIVSSNVELNIGEDLNTIYLYGKDGKNGKFDIDLLCNNKEHLIMCKSHQYTFPYYVMSAAFFTFAILPFISV